MDGAIRALGLIRLRNYEQSIGRSLSGEERDSHLERLTQEVYEENGNWASSGFEKDNDELFPYKELLENPFLQDDDYLEKLTSAQVDLKEDELWCKW